MTSVFQVNPTSEDDNLAPVYVNDAQDREIQELEREADADLATRPQPDEEKSPNNVEKKSSEDPWGIRVLSTTINNANKVVNDVGRGITEAPHMMVSGGMEAVRQTLFALDGLGKWMNDTLDPNGDMPDFADPLGKEKNKPKGESMAKQLGDDIGEPAKPASVTGGLIQSVSQFVVGFIPLLKATKLAAGGKATSALGRVTQAEVAAAGAGALVFDPHEERLSNLVEKFDVFRNPITEYLAASPEDSEAEGRLKNAVEGLGLGALVEGFIRSLRAIKANRIEKGIEPKGDLGADVVDEEQIVRNDLGDPAQKGFVTDEAADKFRRGEIPSSETLS